MVVLEEGGVRFYMDSHLSTQLGMVRGLVEDDDDYVLLVTGQEGAGKSVFAMQVARRLDPGFCLDRVVFNPKDFEKRVLGARPRECIVYDEAYGGLSSSGGLTAISRKLVGLMTQMRQKNLFVIVVLPSLWLLNWYAAVHRSRGLFYVYRNHGKRGYWAYYNSKRKNLLYELPRKLRSRNDVNPNFRGRFLNEYVVDEAAYRRKKALALREKDIVEDEPKYIVQRNVLIYLLNRVHGVTLDVLRKECKERGVVLSKSALGYAVKRVEKHGAEEEEE